MADLQSCYFCGAPDDVGEYAVVPPRLGGGDRSVALCADCKTKLLRVMEPLIERAEAGADGDAGGSDGADRRSDETIDGGAPDSTPNPSGGVDEDGITMSTGGAEASGSAPGETAPADGDAEPAASTVASGADGDTPPQYRRAMRMLSNREFPIERNEVESMLANAYDLEREEIDAVLDHAEAEGRLAAEDGEIREP